MYKLKKSFLSIPRQRLISLGLCLVALVLLATVSGQEQKSASYNAAMQYLQERGEVILRFAKPSGYSIDYLTTILSIDKFHHDTVTAYANKTGFSKFLLLKIPFEVLQPTSLKTGLSIPSAKKTGDWRDHYPTYPEYINLMEGFAADYPGLCRLTQFGTSINGHKLLALKISDNPGEQEIEPVLLYSSTIHGNETLGYALMLRLIDHLLTNYETSVAVKHLVDNMEIWINPLANPDGSYYISDTTLAGATRFNANHTDLNRDFPDPRDYKWADVHREPETQAMMDFMTDIRLVLAANFHGGAEVVNYPWDTWAHLHADDQWYRYISRHYADTAQSYGPQGYMTDLDNGITNGYAWYALYGGRQDYTNYFLHAREVTIELSEEDMPAEDKLDDFWNYNKNSLLQYAGQALTGITGVVTDSVSGKPVAADIRIENHDDDNSYALSSSGDGIYYRLIGSGDYKLRVSAPDYLTKNSTLRVSEGELTQHDVQLIPLIKAIYPNPFSDVLYIYIFRPGDDLHLEFFDLSGRKVRHIIQPVAYTGKQTVDVRGLASGIYVVRINYGNETWKQLVVRNNISNDKQTN